MSRLSFTTPLGTCHVSWNDTVLTGFSLPGGTSTVADPNVTAAPIWVRELVGRVRQHLAGTPQDFRDVPLDWSQVSAFQRRVYEQTVAIKPGATASYGDIARALSLGPEGARAVGVALGSNPWPLVVPCHRVVAADGRMTGFSAPGGVRTKTRLLALEGAELPLG
jgi:methylated-DNA-[protein]-cysteine S-methyltransferase